MARLYLWLPLSPSERGSRGGRVRIGIHWRGQRDVVEVDAAEVGVVTNEHVAGAEAIHAVGAHDTRDFLHQRAEVVGLGEGLGNGAQVGIKEGAGEVGTRLDVGGVGATLESQ